MGAFTFKEWYKQNKGQLSKKRMQRYQVDKAYRQTILARSRKYRIDHKSNPVPDGYVYHMTGAAEHIGVSIWTLREWRRKNYFPEPHEEKGRLWFTGNQVQLLGQLRTFFTKHGVRTSAANKGPLTDLVNLIYANWAD
jgi:hypothetical protein